MSETRLTYLEYIASARSSDDEGSNSSPRQRQRLQTSPDRQLHLHSLPAAPQPGVLNQHAQLVMRLRSCDVGVHYRPALNRGPEEEKQGCLVN